MISKNVFDKCIDKGLTVAFSESMTGGNLSFEMIKNEGSSKVLLGSIVAYHKDLKRTLLSVNPIIIDEHSVVSQEVADQMVYGIRNHTDADVCVSITGNAGPTLDFQTSKKEAYISILYLNKLYQYHLDLISDSRIKNIEDATVFVYQKIEEIL